MNNLAVKHLTHPTHPTQAGQLTAANEHHGDAGLNAIAAMRTMLGKNSAASQFDKLTQQQRALVLFAARLKPSEFLNRPLMSLTAEQREAVRRSIIALMDLSRAFSNLSLSRDQFISKPKLAPAIKQQANSSPSAQPQDELSAINRQMVEVMAQMDGITNHETPVQ
jgi:hypothetical protein